MCQHVSCAWCFWRLSRYVVSFHPPFLRKVYFFTEHLLFSTAISPPQRFFPPNPGASKCICGVGCGALMTFLGRWVHVNSNLCWWPPTIRERSWIESPGASSFFLSLGVVFLGVLLMEVGIFHNECAVISPRGRARGVTMTSYDVEAAMQELSPKLLKQIELRKK